VILLRRGSRHGDRGLELLLLRRGDAARFMPGVWVFAGGIVDEEDRAAPGEAPATVDADEWAHRVCGARELAEEAGVEIGAGELAPWSRWITPTPVAARFDTRFYVALAPPHCRPEPDGTEMDEARWTSPADALAAYTSDELALSFPTIRHLEELAGFDSADEVIAAAAERTVEPILPRVTGTRERHRVLLPGEPGYEDGV
jgi:8-oxo-dGTP pyrophosphatase MutT (NUDIX family)